MTPDADVADAQPRVGDGRRHLFLYLAIGGLSYVVDTGLLLLISGPLGAPLWLATTVGFWVSVILNFSLNRLVFAQPTGGSTVGAHSIRYGVLLGLNYLVTLAIVTLGVSWGWSPIVPKTIAVALTTTWNFVLYRRWVFR